MRRLQPPKQQRSNALSSAASSSTFAGRSRNVLTKAGPSHRPTPPPDRPQSAAPNTSTNSADFNSSVKSQQTLSAESESNIQVVIRCRRRSEREIQDNSPIIVTSEGARSKQVTIETAAPTSVLGIVQLPPTRTYAFDTVFGPEADQSLVYHDVVQPMLEEVLQGYNCTLFAYGQTGTGKTYTMQGDVSLTPLGNPSTHAGMIPRVLFKLFHQLSGTDYSVKISYVELYNEELRDLLSSELSAPLNSVQPMGMGAPRDSQSVLKIFDDAAKKGVYIQGLEEVGVNDFSDALALLERGTQRRQTASTKFNDHSSRSHTIFTITVHTKEISNLGDDLLKVGKLNLVDLAGSENIGRSGAENKRAREAGMINQSLLTLGRVINALVDKSSHIPYRESKLTRLLQDSLGGRTKTCIIATVSPARCNMEETLSTLDYAMHAKSIRNKPEINQRMTRNALLKDYIAEIERLKADILATREKNGIFFSQEHFEQMEAEKELRQSELAEAKKQADVIESQLRAVREEFEQSIALLMRTDSELKETKATLAVREEDLQKKGAELEDTKIALEEEVIVRKAHASQEEVLHVIAKDLRKVVQESTTDVAGLFAKLDRKMKEFDKCSNTISERCGRLDNDSSALLSSLKSFSKSSQEQLANIRSQVDNFSDAQAALIAEQSTLIGSQIGKLQESLQTVLSRENDSSECISLIQGALQEVQKRLSDDCADWVTSFARSTEEMFAETERAVSKQHDAVENAVSALSSLFDRLTEQTRNAILTERQAAEQQREHVESAMQSEISRLQEQNARLCALLESERRNSKKARDDLVKKVSSLLVDFSEERDRSLREAVYGVKESNEKAVEEIAAKVEEHSAMVDVAISGGQELGESIDEIASEKEEVIVQTFTGLHSARNSVEDGFKKIHAASASSLKTHSDDISKHTHTLGSCAKVFEREHVAKRARVAEVTQLASNAQDALQAAEKAFAQTASALAESQKSVDKTTDSLRKNLGSFSTHATTRVTSVQEHTALILECGTHQELPTGSTPKKRKWRYVEKWERTQSRDSLLRNFRAARTTPTGSEFFTPSIIPVGTPQSLSNEDLVEFPVQSDTDVDVEMESTPTTLHSEMQSCSSTSSEEPFSAQMQKLAAKIPLKARTLQERSTNIALPRPTLRKR